MKLFRTYCGGSKNKEKEIFDKLNKTTNDDIDWKEYLEYQLFLANDELKVIYSRYLILEYIKIIIFIALLFFISFYFIHFIIWILLAIILILLTYFSLLYKKKYKIAYFAHYISIEYIKSEIINKYYP